MVSGAAGPVTKLGFRRDITLFLALIIGYLVFFLVLLLLMLQTSLIRYEESVRQQWDLIASVAVDAIENTASDRGALDSRLVYLQSRYPIVDAELDMPGVGSIRTSVGNPPSEARVTRDTKYGKLILGFDRSALDTAQRRFNVVAIICLASAILGTILFMVYLRKILAPIEQMLDHARELGDRDGNVDEARFLIDTFKYSIDTLKRQEAELTRLHEAEKARADELQVITGTLTRSLATGFLAIGREGEILEVNAAGSEILRLGDDRPMTGPPGAVIGETELARAIEDAFSARATLVRQEVPTITRSGEQIVLGLTTVPLRSAQEEFLGMIVLFTDLTPLRKLDERLTNLQTLADLGEMAAGIAHEFRNSLSAVLGYLKLAQREQLSPAAAARIRSAEDEATRLAEAVTRLLVFARPMNADSRPVTMHELLRQCVDRASDAHPDIRFNLTGDDFTVYGDSALLSRAFDNVLSNATESIVQESGPGEVRVEIDGAGRRIAVADSGKGLDEAIASKAFFPFQSTKPNGFGLGLALVRKIVLLHGGDVKFVDAPQAGAVVEFSFSEPLETLDGQESTQRRRG